MAEFAGEAFSATPRTAWAASQTSCVSLDKLINPSGLQVLQSKWGCYDLHYRVAVKIK